jgi:hypothetical protein
MHVRGSSSGGVSGHWILLLLAYASLHGCTQYETEQSTVSGDSTHLVAAFEGLLATSAADAFLVVGVSGAEDFLQFTAVPGSVQLDYPLITGRQREVRASLERVCADLGLVQVVSSGSDGSEFLDYDINGRGDSRRDTSSRFWGKR